MIRAPISDRKRRRFGIVAWLVVLGGYTVASYVRHLGNAADRILPTWHQLWDGLVFIASVDPDDHVRPLVANAIATGERFFLGFGLSVAVSFILGIAMVCSRKLRAFVLPPLSAIAGVPQPAVIPIFIYFFGTDTLSFVCAIAIGVVPTLTETICLDGDLVPDENIHKAYTLGASSMEVAWNVIVPQLLPKIIDAVRLQVRPVFLYLIGTELAFTDVGFGYAARRYGFRGQMDITLPYIAALALFGLTLVTALALLRTTKCRWYQPKKGGA